MNWVSTLKRVRRLPGLVFQTEKVRYTKHRGGTGSAHPMSPKGLRLEAGGQGVQEVEMNSEARGRQGQGLQQRVIKLDEIQLHEYS